MATQRQLSKEKSIAAILEAASAEFAEKGYADATVRSIAARAGVATGLISRYFESKDNLLCRIINETDLKKIYEDTGDTDPFRVICIYLDYVRRIQKEDPKRFNLVLRIVSERTYPDAVYDTVRKGFEGSVLMDAICRAQKEGELPEGDAFGLFMILSGSIYVLLDQYEKLGIGAPDDNAILQVLGYNRREKEYEEALKKASEFENFKKRLNEDLISRMSDTDGLFLIDCIADTRKTVHDLRALKNEYRDDEQYSAAINRYISSLVIEEDREMMREATSPGYMREHTARGEEYRVEYRSISTGVPRFYEMHVARFSDTEVLQSFKEKDDEIFNRFIFKNLENEYFALFGVDLDTGTAKILKKSPWYEKGAAGDVFPYTDVIRKVSASFEGETRAFYERISDIDWLRQRLAKDEKATYAYKSPLVGGDRWVSTSVRVLSRHKDGTPFLLALGFSLLDSDATEKHELQRQLGESLTFTNYFLDRFVSAYYVGLDDLSCQIYQRTDKLNEDYPIISDYMESLDKYIANDVHPEDRELLKEITRPDNLKKALEAQPEITRVFRDITGGDEKIYRFQAIRGADREHAAFGFIDITEEINEQKKILREAEESRRLIESVADRYDLAYIVNTADDSLKRLKMKAGIANREKLEHFRCFGEIRDTFMNYIRPDDRKRLLKEFDYGVIRDKLKKTNSYNIEYRAVVEGISSWYEMNITGINETYFALGFADRDIEITKRRLEEKRYDEYFALFVADIDTGMIKIVKNEERYQVVKVGDSAAYTPYILGLSQEFDGVVKEFYTKLSDLDYVKRELAKDDKRTFSYRSAKYAGNRWIELTTYVILRHEDGTPAMFTLGFSIIDALATAREELRKRLEDTLEKANVETQRNDILTSIVKGSKFTYDISADDEVTGAHYAEVSAKCIGEQYLDRMDWIELLHPEDKERVYGSFMATVRDHDCKTPYDETFRMLGTNGKYRWVRSGGNVVRREDGTGEFYGISLDITDQMEEQERQQKQLEEALASAESANRAKTEFLFNMSHDVRTPMNAILGFTNMAEKHIDDREKVIDCLEKTKQSGGLLLSLINGVLDMSRIEHGSAEKDEKAGDVCQSFRSIEAAMLGGASEKDISLSFEYGEITDRYVYADSTRCLRILTNLITNSIKYTREGGCINVRCEQVSPAENGIARYAYTIQDNGIGMSEEFQKHMYETFSREYNSTTSGIQGTGLGLSVCKAFVDFLGGSIDCESKTGIGTKFTVVLPFRVQQEQYYTDVLTGELVKEASRIGKNPETEFRGRKVLLVEDNELNREIAVEILEEAGLVVDEAEDGSIAVKILKEKGPDAYDCILMDIQMPVMNGYEATKEIREMYPEKHIPIIALSANAFDEDKAESVAAGMDDHVAKPIVIRDLFGSIARFI